ncbi:MAG: DNA ligase, partial [Myxococcales bacterium]|nr:DNA ligase [Myxococcales bacterium]
MSSSNHGKPPVLLAHKWATGHDPAGWWMSEKLDGVRAYWDGRRFLSRQGNEYIAPSWFTRPLPRHPLDGELWIDRKQFQKCVGVVRRQKADDGWKQVKYLVFDAPSHGGIFEDRVEHLTDLITGMGARHVVAVDHVRCRDHAHLITEFNRVEALGGEGLMLREPRSMYAAGRSRSLLKVKRFHDAEAKVLGYIDGQGRHAGRVGALSVVTPGGVHFAIGSGLSDADRDDPPKIGAIVTFRYQELTDAGVPRFPTFVRIRDDFDWPTNGASASRPVASSVPLTPAAARASSGSGKT